MKSTLALSAAALLAVAKAQDPIVQGKFSSSLNSDDWDSIAEEPNLTGAQSFTGKDVSSPYPGSNQNGWELSLSVRDGFEAPSDAPDGHDLLTATSISMSAPDGETEFDDSWRLCVHVFPVKASSAVDGFGHEFESNCMDLVATECVEDLRKQGRKKFGAGCESWKITPSCRRDLNEQKGWSTTINADNAEQMLSGNSSFFRRTDGTHPEDDDMANLQTAAVMPVAVVNIFGSASESDDEPYAEVVCIMPDTVADGAEDPFEVEDAAPSVGKFFGWAALTAAAAAFIL